MPQNDQMRHFFETHSTAELQAIWLANDRTAWIEEAFVVIEEILRQRGEPLVALKSAEELAPVIEPPKPDNLPDGGIRAMVRGELSLPVTYWLFGVLPAVAFRLAQEVFGTTPFGIATSLVWLIYLPFPMIGLWRCAGCYRGLRVWAILARIQVAVVVLLIAATFVMIIKSFIAH